MVKRNILLNPGPATTTDTVKQAQVAPDICPREKEFGEMMSSIRKDLVKIAGGDKNYTSVLFGGSGTAVMDSVVNSVVPHDKKILIINNGAYGERLINIAKAYKIDFVELRFECGTKIDLEQIKSILKKDGEISCVAVTHHETTIGILNPIEEIGEITKQNNCTFIVDTISSFAGIPFSIIKCNIDFMMSTSNKCIQGMAGVGFVICNKNKLIKTKNYSRRSFYLNLYDQYEYFEKNNQMRFTPPVQVLYALRQAIDEFFEEGAENRYKRYCKNWETLVNGMEKLGFKRLLNNDDEESHILTTFLDPDDSNYNFEKMHDLLKEKGFTIYPGKLRDEKTFRLANMGAIDYKDIESFLITLNETLKEMRIKNL